MGRHAVSHYNGNLYTLSLNGGKLPITSQLKACGGMPSWLELDSDFKNVYCTDESGAQGGATLTALSVADNGALKVSGTARSLGGEVPRRRLRRCQRQGLHRRG